MKSPFSVPSSRSSSIGAGARLLVLPARSLFTHRGPSPRRSADLAVSSQPVGCLRHPERLEWSGVGSGIVVVPFLLLRPASAASRRRSFPWCSPSSVARSKRICTDAGLFSPGRGHGRGTLLRAHCAHRTPGMAGGKFHRKGVSWPAISGWSTSSGTNGRRIICG